MFVEIPYIKILEKLVEMNFSPKLSFQVRFETIKGESGKRFLKLISRLDATLEFGLQTMSKNYCFSFDAFKGNKTVF